jgi:hypothetical protein
VQQLGRTLRVIVVDVNGGVRRNKSASKTRNVIENPDVLVRLGSLNGSGAGISLLQSASHFFMLWLYRYKQTTKMKEKYVLLHARVSLPTSNEVVSA